MPSDEKEHKKKVKKLMFLLKATVTIALCTIILLYADWSSIIAAIMDSNKLLILIVFLCMLLNIVISAMKWQVLLVIHGIRHNLISLTKFYLTGMFFSNFLPSMIGGDGYRMFKVFQSSRSKVGAVLPVVFERLIGIVVLLVLGLLTSIASYLVLEDEISKIGIVFGAIGSAVSGLMIAFFVAFTFQKWIVKQSYIPEKVKKIIQYFDDYRRHWKNLFKCIAFSLFFYVFLFIYRYLLLIAVGDSCPFFSLAFVTMISTFVANIPISINGIGPMDGTFIYFITKFGVGYESAIVVMVLQRTLSTGISLLGGLVYFKDKDAFKLKDSEKQNIQQMKETTL